MKIRLPIDIKSLYMNIKNDNKTGHTATVATPLKQGNSVHEELAKILQIPEVQYISVKEELSAQILSKSRVAAMIPKIYVFDRLMVNGEELSNTPNFCMYIREETDPANVHYGRQKVHYPPSLCYEDDYVNIDNKKVMNAISKKLLNYAFIVEAFEYDTETGVLNFDILIVGENQIPYSKVFLNKKGTGNKFTGFFNETIENYDTEIIALREHLGYENVGIHNYREIQQQNKDAAIEKVMRQLEVDESVKIRNLVNNYPYSLYDLCISCCGKKEYVIVCFTATKLTYFTLPYAKIKFCTDYKEKVRVALVKDVSGKASIEWYSFNDLNIMSKSINSVVYESRG